MKNIGSAVLSLALMQSVAWANDVSVKTSEGVVVGESLGNANVFKGIPYAAAPVGALRFKAPVKHAPWSAPLQAKAYGSKCLQIDPTAGNSKVLGNEDCLYLNIWQSAAPHSQSLPVMVFIHGGGNFFGSGSDNFLGGEIYNGQYLAEHGPAVVVNLNYRLGPMGFLAHPAISKESGYGGSGNYGILDQIAALHWIKENAAAFGGDANNITVFGESAGGIDIFVLLASPLAHGLFNKAIVESGLITDYPLSQTEANGQKLAETLGCEKALDQAACLRGLSGEAIISASYTGDIATSFASSPTLDGNVLMEPIVDTLMHGTGNPVPLMVGTNADEMTTLAPLMSLDKVTSADIYSLMVNQIYGSNAAKVLAQYPVASYATPTLAAEDLLGDDLFHCVARRMVRAVSANSVPVWRYVFSHVADSPFLSSYRAGHMLEMPYVFRNNDKLMSARETAFADTMSSYWMNFARSGNPNSNGLPAWPASSGDEYDRLDLSINAETGFHTQKCDFWDSLGEK